MNETLRAVKLLGRKFPEDGRTMTAFDPRSMTAKLKGGAEMPLAEVFVIFSKAETVNYNFETLKGWPS